MNFPLAVILLSVMSFSIMGECEDIDSLFDEKVHGERSIQRDSNMCYAFSLSHAFRILSNDFINPLDIAYQFQRYKNPARKVQYYDMAIGADLEFYDDSFIETLLAWGFCSKELSPLQKKLLSNQDIKNEAQRTNRNYLSYFNELIDTVGKDCREDRLFTKGVRPLFMPIRDFNGRKVITSDNGIKAINNLLKRRTPVVLNTSLKILGRNTGNHSMLIVGSRKSNDSCSYEILDSLSKDFCESIKKEDVIAKDCSTGHYWISEESLKEHIISVIGFRVR